MSGKQTGKIKNKVLIKSPFPDFAINTRGFIVDPVLGANQFKLLSTQNVLLESPGPKGTRDSITIQILPLGGISVTKKFN